ncbi:MAG TPA: hypothetical protein VGD98_25380 [Ktedonobacteraceae bacterium]
MKIITRICVFLLAAGLVAGWVLWGEFAGSAVGLFFAGCIVVPLYCLANVHVRNATALRDNSMHDRPDPSQQVRSTYNRLTGGNII